jgi:hypothetical protein
MELSTEKSSQIFDGGEGGRSVGQSCGSIRPTEKVKMEKGAKSPLSITKKKELVALIKQSLGAIQQRKKPNEAKPFPPTRLGTELDSPAFKVNNPHASWRSNNSTIATHNLL